jgi:hypothetical protein
MRRFLLLPLLLLLLPFALALQDLLPRLPPSQERVQLLPVLFCFGVLALPLVPALFFALAAAVVQALAILQIQSGQAEFGLTEPIVFFLSWAIVLQMASEITHGMRWELHALGSFLVTLTLLGSEFLMLCIKRGGLPVDGTVLLRIGIPAAASLLLAPLLYLALGSLVPLASETQKVPKREK